MVLYCCTEVETLLKNAQQTIRRKRGRDESKVAVDDMWTTSAADKADFASAIFNIDSFKGRRGCEMLTDETTAHKWRIASFRTDGVVLAVTFVICITSRCKSHGRLKKGCTLPVSITRLFSEL